MFNNILNNILNILFNNMFKYIQYLKRNISWNICFANI